MASAAIPPTAIVIFGASGDLAKLKLIPAIYELLREKLLPEKFVLVGYSRTPMTDQEFRDRCKEAITKNARSKAAGLNPELWKILEPRIFYRHGDYGAAEAFDNLKATLADCDQKFGTVNRLFYISTPPNAFMPIIKGLGERKLVEKGIKPGAPAQRIIIEKPFGRDLASAHELNGVCYTYLAEEQIFRIDHYLGKETVQNLMVMRFANSIFEPIWNYKYIDHVQIPVAETVNADDRGGYYDKAGAMRDMIQNHIFQLMALVAMEPPVALDAQAIRDEKVKVYKSIRPIRVSQMEEHAIRGQYGAGEAHGKKSPGYLKAKDVAPDSRTETFAALKVNIDNWRWSGAPFYIRTGKFLPRKVSEVVVRFRSPPQTLFQLQHEAPIYPNDLIIRVAPEEGISVRLNGKVPGGTMNIKSVALDFNYKGTFNVEAPEAYERLIHDGIVGDQSLFIRGDETIAAWTVIDPIEKYWAESKTPPHQYAPGTWGPKAADQLIERDGRRWLQSSDEAEPIMACAL
jgi:glucose-6-phosphate 1-dehydrogenase